MHTNHNIHLPHMIMYSSRKHIYKIHKCKLGSFKRLSKNCSRPQGSHFVRAKFLWEPPGGLRGLEFKYLYRPHFVWTNRAVKIPTLFVAKSLGSQARGVRLAGRWWTTGGAGIHCPVYTPASPSFNFRL